MGRMQTSAWQPRRHACLRQVGLVLLSFLAVAKVRWQWHGAAPFARLHSGQVHRRSTARATSSNTTGEGGRVPVASFGGTSASPSKASGIRRPSLAQEEAGEGFPPPRGRRGAKGTWTWRPQGGLPAGSRQEEEPEAAPGEEAESSALPQWFKEMQDEGLQADGSVLNALVGESVKQGDFEAAGAFFREASKAGSEPDAQSFDAMVLAAVARESTYDAMELVTQARESGCMLDPRSLLSVLQLASRMQDIDTIEELLDHAIEVDAQRYGSLFDDALKAALRANDLAAAMKWLGQALSNGIAVQRGTYNTFIRSVADGCGFLVAQFWVREAATLGLKADLEAHTILLIAAWRSGERDGGRQVLEQVLPADADNESLRDTINELARFVCDSGEAGVIGYLADLVIERGIEFDLSDETANLVLGLAARTQDLNSVRSWFERLYNGANRRRPPLAVYKTMVSAAAEAEDADEAERWYNEILAAGYSVDAYLFNTILGVMAKQRKMNEARLWLVKMRQARIEPTIMHYTTLAYVAARNANLTCAEEWFEEALSLDLQLDCFIYSAVIDAASRAGNLRVAERYYEELLESGLPMTVVPFNAMMGAAMRTARRQQAEDVFSEMVRQRVRPNAESLRTLRWAVGKGRLRELCNQLNVDPDTGRFKPLRGSRT